MTSQPASFGLKVLCPQPPQWNIDWRLVENLDWFRAMRGVEQSAQHHREGDVQTHVRMVCEELVASPRWRALAAETREELFAVALLHDVSKPECFRRDEHGQISSRGHARRGAVRARAILWKLGVCPLRRERICSWVRFHMLLYHLLDRRDSERWVLRVAEAVRWDLLAIHAQADTMGRICDDRDDILSRIDLALEYIDDRGCLAAPYPFANDHSRFLYFRGARARPDDPVWEKHRCTVTLMSGLPGAGKDRWLAHNRNGLPCVSLDVIRGSLKVPPHKNQGVVVQVAKERAREHLRAGQDFVWNATNLSQQLRSQCVSLLAQYQARIEIVTIEAPYTRLFEQNRQRNNVVPAQVIEKLLTRWEFPERTEAHSVTVITGA